MGIHLIIILVIVVISVTAFSQPQIVDKYKFNAYRIFHNKELLRLISHGFLHGSWTHLLVNMFVLFSFGGAIIRYFDYYLQGRGNVLFLILFLTSIVFSSLYSLYKEKENPYYSAIGASGAVSAVVFASILFDPHNKILLFAVIPIPGFVFGALYLVYSKMMANKGTDNIGHDAHFWGAVYGFIFPILYKPALFSIFIKELFYFL